MTINQTHIDLLNLVQNDTVLKKTASTGGGEWHGPCPFCGGKDRFSVQPSQGRWYCRHCQDKGGDAIAYVMRRQNIDFKAALRYLGLAEDNPPPRGVKSPRPTEPTPPPVNDLKEDYIALTDSAWQRSAHAFVQHCRDLLHSPEGKAALDYLLERGIPMSVIQERGLGYHPAEVFSEWGKTKVKLPAGIVIPWQLGGVYWNIRVRSLEPEADPKYLSPKGVANGLYCGIEADPSLPIEVGDTVILVEGEFDAMLLQHFAQDALGTPIKVLATGSSAGGRVLTLLAQLNIADCVLLAFDNDSAGDRAAAWWQSHLPEKAQRIRPTHHDINDMLKAGVDLAAWLLHASSASEDEEEFIPLPAVEMEPLLHQTMNAALADPAEVTTSSVVTETTKQVLETPSPEGEKPASSVAAVDPLLEDLKRALRELEELGTLDEPIPVGEVAAPLPQTMNVALADPAEVTTSSVVTVENDPLLAKMKQALHSFEETEAPTPVVAAPLPQTVNTALADPAEVTTSSVVTEKALPALETTKQVLETLSLGKNAPAPSLAPLETDKQTSSEVTIDPLLEDLKRALEEFDDLEVPDEPIPGVEIEPLLHHTIPAALDTPTPSLQVLASTPPVKPVEVIPSPLVPMVDRLHPVRSFIAGCVVNLQRLPQFPQGVEALARRGLGAHLGWSGEVGYNPTTYTLNWDNQSLEVPIGLIIPAYTLTTSLTPRQLNRLYLLPFEGDPSSVVFVPGEDEGLTLHHALTPTSVAVLVSSLWNALTVYSAVLDMEQVIVPLYVGAAREEWQMRLQTLGITQVINLLDRPAPLSQAEVLACLPKEVTVNPSPPD